MPQSNQFTSRHLFLMTLSVALGFLPYVAFNENLANMLLAFAVGGLWGSKALSLWSEGLEDQSRLVKVRDLLRKSGGLLYFVSLYYILGYLVCNVMLIGKYLMT